MMNSVNDTTNPTDLSWQNNFLKDLLYTKTVRVKFFKKDGTERQMLCTLRQDMLPTQVDLEESINKKKPNPDVIAVFDLEKEAWRSFRFDSVIGFSEEL